MFFKNVFAYEITKNLDLSDFSEKLGNSSFVPCGNQDQKKMGWIPPLHECGGEDMILASEGRVLITLKVQERLLPSSVINKAVDKKVEELEARQDRKVFRKERAGIKDDVIASLLPRSHTKDTYLSGYISTDKKWLVINTSSEKSAIEFCALLRHCLGSLPIIPFQGKTEYSTLMTGWIDADYDIEALEGISFGSNITLEGDDSNVAKLKGVDYFSDEVCVHIESGKKVRELEMFANGAFGFNLTDEVKLKGIKWDKEYIASNGSESEDPAVRFDTDFVLMGGMIDMLLDHLLVVLEVDRQWHE